MEWSYAACSWVGGWLVLVTSGGGLEGEPSHARFLKNFSDCLVVIGFCKVGLPEAKQNQTLMNVMTH